MELVTLAKIQKDRLQEGCKRINEIPSMELPDNVIISSAKITYGSYGLVINWEAPDMKTANKFLAMLTRGDLFITETMAAHDIEDS